ncbi:MAG: TPM domain-containing protein, partial [Oscillospiraceae bacterium]|nr:TPM domain-containing protein [Oscillospiraceae bacterium]
MKKLACFLLVLSVFILPLTALSAETEVMTNYCVYDVSDILTDVTWDILDDDAMMLSKEYKCGVYAVLVPGFEDYTHYDDDMAKAAADIIVRNTLGYGADRDAVLLLIDTDKCKCSIGSSGPRGRYIFNDDAIETFDAAIAASVSSGDHDTAISLFIADCKKLFEYEKENGVAYLYSGTGVTSGSDKSGSEMITSCVYDYAGILSAEEAEKLENKARYLSELYEFGVYIYIVDDYYDVYPSSDVFYACEHVYETQGFGYGSSNRDGIMLFMSMDERDYATYRTVGKGYYAFTDYGLYELEEYFLGPFRSNDWYGGFQNYLQYCDYLLDMAEKGTPVDYVPGGNNDPTYPGNGGSTKLTAEEKCIILAPG